MNECLACEKQYFQTDSTALKKRTYCSTECEVVFDAALLESAEESKIAGLVDAEGNSILGGAYQQSLNRTIREAAAKIGIKLPSNEE
jgi:hypothetical protein